MKKSFNYSYNQCQQHTENNHTGDGKIKTEIFFFYPYITRQTTYPIQFIMKEINEHSGDYDKNANDNNPFSGIAVHSTKIRLNNAAMDIYRIKDLKRGIKKGTHN